LAVLVGSIRFYSRRLIHSREQMQTLVAARTQELASRNQQLEKINTIVQAINAEFDFNRMVYTIIREISSVVDVDKAGMLMRDKSDGTFKARALHGWDQAESDSVVLTATEAEDRYVNGTLELAEDVFLVRDVKGRPVGEKVSHLGLAQVMLVIRIRSEQQVEGYLVLENMRRADAFRDDDVAFLVKLKNHIAMAFSKAKLMIDLAGQREAAERANVLKSQFLANVSHEIRTPMNAILGFAKILRDDERDQEKREQLEIIGEAGENLLKLINDILDLSKIEADKLEINPLAFSPRKLLGHLQRIFEIRCKEKGISLQVTVGVDVPEFLYGDSHRLNQLLVNVVGNAVKFTRAGGVFLHCRHAAGMLFVEVRDTGIGVSADKQAQIFEPFVQADGSTTREYGGTGLGLAICQRIARLMGGEITLQSQLGVGSVFSLRLPMPRSAPQDMAQTIELDRLEAGAGGHVIGVINDDQNESDLIKAILRRGGHQPVQVGNGHDVVAEVLASRAELILLDLVMPGQDGAQVNELLKRDPRTARLPVLNVSGSGSAGDSAMPGVVDYIRKPFRDDEMLKRIYVALRVQAEIRTIVAAAADEAVLKALASTLRRAHFNVFPCATAAQACALLATGLQTDALVLVLPLPQADAAPFPEQVPLVMVAADADAQTWPHASLALVPPGEAAGQAVVDALNIHFQRRSYLGARLVQTWLDKLQADAELEGILLDAVRLLPRRLAELEPAVRDRDHARVEFLAHDIKGFCVNLGMDEVAAPAQELVDAVRQPEWPGARIAAALDRLNDLAQTLSAGLYVRRRPESEPPLQKTDLRVLVAEDEAVNRRLMTAYFKRLGYACDLAVNGQEALQFLRGKPYDVVFLDIQMPVRGGLDVVADMRRDPALKDIFAVALTAHAIKGDAERFLLAGFDEYLAKPVSVDQLAEKLELALRRSQLAQRP
jgi:signal transduction histidine kinase/CheY-like chemotaxis protein